MKILWGKRLIKLSNGSYITWGLKRKKFFFSNKNELKLNAALIEYYEKRERCGEKVLSDYRRAATVQKEQLTKAKEIIKKLIALNRKEWIYSDVREEAENFLKESEVEK